MMKRLALVTPLLLLTTSHVIADDYFTPYVGLDAQIRTLNYRSGFGNNVLTHNYPEGNIYAGLKFNDYIGAEIGLQGGPKRNRNATINTGDQVLGDLIPANQAIITPLVYSTSTRLSGITADLVGYFPLTCDIQAYISVGANRLRARFQHVLLSASVRTVIGTQYGESFALSKTKTILRLGAGLQQMLTDNVGVRAGFKWENVCKLKDISAPSSQIPTMTGGTPTIKLKDSFTYNLGIFWKF